MLERSQRRYEFKTADSARERAEVNRLLYRTFVLEIPRYDDPGTGFLIDRFDRSNIYFVAIHNGRVCGTMAVHDGPVFSVASAIADSTCARDSADHSLKRESLPWIRTVDLELSSPG